MGVMRFIGFIITVFFLCLCGGCDGGGTVGSGVIDTNKTILAGTVADFAGNPIPGATISVVGDGQVTQTDERGNFALEVDEQQTEVVVNVSKDDKQSQVTLPVRSTNGATEQVNVVLQNTGNFTVQNARPIPSETPPTTVPCLGPPREEEVVCGKDGRNYPSACFAQAAGVQVDYPGRCGFAKDCETDTVCGVLVDCHGSTQVCGKDGRTYSSARVAHERNVGVAYRRACVQMSYISRVNDCSIECLGPPSDTDKVCGTDNVTYPSECLAVKNRIEAAFPGACDAASSCDVDPVCGVYTSCQPGGSVCAKDNRTYPSEAAALAAGVGVVYHRECLELSFVVDCTFSCMGPPPTEARVCGTDGVTYPSECGAWVLGGVQVAYPGPC